MVAIVLVVFIYQLF